MRPQVAFQPEPADDPVLARRLLELVAYLPKPVWGRDELGECQLSGQRWPRDPDPDASAVARPAVDLDPAAEGLGPAT